MTVPTLELPPEVAISPGSGMEENARVLVAQFGSNYAQRAADGLNSVSSQYSVTFENLTRDEGETIIAFFRARKGSEAFYFTPPGDSEKMWRCEKWSRTHVDAAFDTINATFIQVFTP